MVICAVVPDLLLRTCPICGLDNRSQPVHPYSEPPWELKQCAGCGLLYLENAPAYQKLETEFAWEKTWAEEGRRRRRREPVLYYAGRALQAIPKRLFRRDKLMSWVRRYFAPGQILDVGCAGGHTLLQLPDGYVPFGIEVSRELADMARTRFSARGGDVIQGNAISALLRLPADSFSGVLMTSYLEHEVDPRTVLEQVARIMRPGARAIIKVPNFACWNRRVRGTRWCGFRYPDHVNYFTPALLDRLLRAGGLRVLRFAVWDRFPFSDNMWLVAEKLL
ncbi:MAG: class I SAM-dependent methyltransferase [Terriglobales bacterium]